MPGQSCHVTARFSGWARHSSLAAVSRGAAFDLSAAQRRRRSARSTHPRNAASHGAAGRVAVMFYDAIRTLGDERICICINSIASTCEGSAAAAALHVFHGVPVAVGPRLLFPA
jgi:hypothetical protein